MSENEKRKRGGQPGNQNARKHGYFTQDSQDILRQMASIAEEYKQLNDQLNQLTSKSLFMSVLDETKQHTEAQGARI